MFGSDGSARTGIEQIKHGPVLSGRIVRRQIQRVRLLRVLFGGDGRQELSRRLRGRNRYQCGDQKNQLANHAVIVVEYRHA